MESDHSLEEPGQDDESKLVLRRSTRERKPPDYYSEWVTIANSELGEPTSIEEAMSGPDKVKLQEAMGYEMESLQEKHVWNLVELSKDKKAIGSKWVVKLKTNTDGSVERYKARLVAQGFSQKFVSDYDETFSPVVRFESVRTVISLATQHGLQIDVTTAFLNGDLKEEVHMKQDFHSTLDLSITLGIARRGCDVLKMPAICKLCKLSRRILWFVVGDYYLWNSMATEMHFQLRNNCPGVCISSLST